MITSVQVRSRRDPSSPWRQRGRATLSNLESAADGSLSIALEGDHRDRFWQITSQPALDRPPAVELRARAEELAFLAQGEGPWQLYAGGRQASRTVPVARLLEEAVSRLGPAWQWPRVQLLDRQEAAGEAALLEPPEPLPWQRILLWGILVAGAIVLVTMAARLLRRD